MLVIHGDKDYRVPIGEALRLWYDLQKRGVPSRFLYFPDENHWVLTPGNAGVKWDPLPAQWRWGPPMTSKKPTRSAIYVRISDDREGKGLGVERQEQDCRALAERLGWTLHPDRPVYADNDIGASAKSRKARPA